jgi:hypothetical protein
MLHTANESVATKYVVTVSRTVTMWFTVHGDIGLFNSLTLLGALEKLRKVLASPRLSVRMKQLGSHRTDFHEI